MSLLLRLGGAITFVVAVLGGFQEAPQVRAEGGTEFMGTVVAVDTSSGKFAVKKDGGGSRFTFVANDKTRFEGGPKAVKDLKKDDHVTVTYQVQGPQYVAVTVTLKK